MAGKTSNNSTKRRTVLIIALFALFLLTVFFALPSITRSANGEPARDQILSRLAGNGIAATGEPTITKITGIEGLKSAKPVIYRNAADGQYEVKWPTLLVIYDYARDEVVNSMSITRVETR